MSGWNPSRPPWETSDHPVLPPDESYYGRPHSARVIIKPHADARGSRPRRGHEPPAETSRGVALFGVLFGLAASVGIVYGAVQLTHVSWGEPPVTTVSAPASTPVATPSASPSATGTTPAASPTATGGNALGAGRPGP